MKRARLLLSLVSGLTAASLALAAPASAATVVASWNMGDSGSTMSDASGRGHTGTLHNVTVRQPGATATGFGYGFATTPAWVSVPASADFVPGAGNLRIALSARMTSVPSPTVVDYDLLRMGLGTTTGGDYKVEVLQNGRAYCFFRGSLGGVAATGGPNLADDRWHRLTCARVGASVVLTVDGVTVRTARDPGTITASTTLFIGAKDGSGADQYRGRLDAVTITKG